MLKAIKASIVLILSTLFALVLQEIGFRVENILMIYVVGVLIVIIETHSYLWGGISTVLFAFTFNFFFTAPRYTFMIDDPNYFVSFIIFMVVAMIVCTLTTRLQKQIKLAEYSEDISSKLYKVSHGFLNLTGEKDIIYYSERCLQDRTTREIKLYIRPNEEVFTKVAGIWWCYQHAMPCGKGESHFLNLEYKCIPIKSNHKTLGVAKIGCLNEDLTSEEVLYINTILSQMTIALERDWLNALEEENKMQIEKEKVKNNLLRSISHDLRTPLTGIGGGAAFLHESLEELDTKTIKSILEDISGDALWLSKLVENLLNMTRIQEGKLSINRKKEVIDDIISEAVERVAKRIKEHTLVTKTPEEIILVSMDGQLMIQVLVNLIDNALSHTTENSHIEVKAYTEENKMIFEVADDGGGLPSDQLDKIFESFFTTAHNKGDKHRGMGLGLSICKTIVEAHEGHINACNNHKGGATFTVTLPLKGVSYE